MKPFVSIILLNYNGEKDTVKCLKSLENLDYPRFEVIVVDNGSKKESVEAVKECVENLKIKVRFYESETNLGFAEGNNVGVRISNGELIALLNNDTWVDKNYLTEMVEVLINNPKTLIVGSKINNLGEMYGQTETIGSLFTVMGEPVNFKNEDESLSFFASGCSMMFRRSVVGEPFDKDYFIYAEDSYASWLARLRGFEVKIAHKSKLDHVGGSVIQNMPGLSFHSEKNKLINVLIFYSFPNLLRVAPLVMQNMCVMLGISLVKKRFFTTSKSYLWVLTHLPLIIKKRKAIQAQRRVSDKEIFKLMTYKGAYNLGIVSKVLNAINKYYSRIVFIPFYEFKKEEEKESVFQAVNRICNEQV